MMKNEDSRMPVVDDTNHSDGAAPTLEQQQEYWKFWQSTRSTSEWALERADVVLGLLRELRLDKPKILDLGCGNGWFAEKMAGLGQVTGMDLNGEAMREAQTHWPHINFLGGSIFEHPFAANSFDIIVSMQVIAHVEDQIDFVERAAELLREGGYFIVTTNNKFVIDRLGSMDWGSHRAAGHIENWLSTTSLKRLMLPRFEVLHTRTLLPMGDGGVLRVINSTKLNAVLERLLPTGYLRNVKERCGLGYYIMIVAQKRSL